MSMINIGAFHEVTGGGKVQVTWCHDYLFGTKLAVVPTRRLIDTHGVRSPLYRRSFRKRNISASNLFFDVQVIAAAAYHSST